MTVEELIVLLETLDPKLDVYIQDSLNGPTPIELAAQEEIIDIQKGQIKNELLHRHVLILE